MKERPILFSALMVRAILEGRKTQTRRIVKPQPIGGETIWFREDAEWPSFVVGTQRDNGGLRISASRPIECPHGKPGDRLWVREAHGIFSVDGSYVSVGYKARLPEGKTLADTDGGLDVIPVYDREQVYWAERHIDPDKWRPSIFMPRWASRITLELTGVRVERLNEITEEDAEAEGATPWEFDPDQPLTTGERAGDSPHRSGFAYLWDCINEDRATWKSNPWVWVEGFRLVN